jgi:hypothetical protein
VIWAFDLGAEAGNSGGENAPVIRHHRVAGHLRRGSALVARGLRNERGFIEKLVPLQHQLLVPVAAIEPKGDGGALPTFFLSHGTARRFGPCAQLRRQGLRDEGGRPGTVIFPREVIIPGGPLRFGSFTDSFLSREAEI